MSPFLSRRGFLLAGAGLAVAAACSGDDKKGQTSATGPSTTTPPLNVIQGSYLLTTGVAQRVAFAVLDDREPLGEGEEVEVAFAPDGGKFSDPVIATRHGEIDNRPYWTATTTFATAGIYGLRVRASGRESKAAIQIQDPTTALPPRQGLALPPVATPTTADGRGVDPICTLDPVCPWHAVSLDTALAEKRPVALMISTPRFCRSQICGPVLESLLGVREEFEAKGVRFVHAEPFTDTTITKASAVMNAYQLQFEPVLYLADATGTIKTSIDGPFDTAEARAALQALTA